MAFAYDLCTHVLPTLELIACELNIHRDDQDDDLYIHYTYIFCVNVSDFMLVVTRRDEKSEWKKEAEGKKKKKEENEREQARW